MPDLRRQPRVVYHTNIRLRPADADESVVARTENLSATGMFVTAADLPAAGTEVLCRMLVGGERCTFKGRVAWVRPSGAGGADTTPGAGIRFVDLNPRESQLLEKVLQPALGGEAPAAENEGPVNVDVWFEGLRAPIKSHALVSDDALSISTKLPFLRLNSPVKLSFVRRGVEEVRSGILEAVTLEPSAKDGVPRLQLTVHTPQPDEAQGEIDIPDTGTVFDPHALMNYEPRTLVDPAAAVKTPPPRLVAPPPARPAGEPARTPSPVVVPAATDFTQRLGRDDEAVTPAPPVPVIPKPRPPRAARLALGLGLVAAVLGAGGAYRILRAPRTAAVASRMKSAANARTSSVQIELLPMAPAGNALRPAPPTESAKEPAPALKTTEARAALEDRVPADKAAAAESAKVPAAVVAAPAESASGEDAPEGDPPPPTEGLGVTSSGEASSLLLGVVGSQKGVQYYRLLDPPGVVVTLPHGKPRAATGLYAPGGAFKRVQIGHRSGGFVFRIYFTSDQVPEVAPESGGVRVTVRPPRRPRRS
jgi:Tfp pilus assembly protein PilZ